MREWRKRVSVEISRDDMTITQENERIDSENEMKINMAEK